MNTQTKLAAGLVCALISGTMILGQGPPDRVIVTLTDGTDPAAAAAQAAARGAKITHVLHHGYSGTLPKKLISDLKTESDVSSIDPDQAIWAAQRQCVVQSPPPDWGLNRICHRGQPVADDGFSYEFDGTGVNVYVLDTGIDTTNPDFGGRASLGADEIDGKNHDCYGHGTAVAGTVGGTKYGAAKGVSLISVRVLDCGGNGLDSDVIAGLEWATDQHLINHRPAVAVMGFEGLSSTPLNAAVNAAYLAGLGSIVSAGNEHMDACNYSPASATGVITVAATDITDRQAPFTNGGTCVALFAPGVNITVDWLHGDTHNLSGTSFSAAYVAGVAAQILQEHPAWTFDQVRGHINAIATHDVIDESPKGCTDTAPHPFKCAPPSPNVLVFKACDV